MKFINFFDYQLSNLDLKNLLDKINNENDKHTKIINCMNPHSFVISQKDEKFKQAFLNAYLNLIDGVGISSFLFLKKRTKINRITGYDLFEKLISDPKGKKIFFLGSTEKNLEKIKNRINKENKLIEVETYSPPFANKFSNQENNQIVSRINSFMPDYLFVGMTAPKQEKWSQEHKDRLNVKFIFNIGAAFDYYAGRFSRPNKIFRTLGLEWLFRLVQTPRLWRRTLISAPKYLFYIIREFSALNETTKIKVIDKIETLNYKINNNNQFIFSALNLAMTSNLLSKKVKHCEDFIYWSDGIFCKFFNTKIKKIAGNRFLDSIVLDKKFEIVHIIGNLQNLDRRYLNQKFSGLKIEFTSLPFGPPEQLVKYVTKIDNNSLIFLTLPTPKQELLAQMILSKFEYGKIICIGGGLSIASGYEKKCPQILEIIGLEFIWRLRSETKRRTIRIIKDVSVIVISLITFKFSKLKVSKYEQI